MSYPGYPQQGGYPQQPGQYPPQPGYGAPPPQPGYPQAQPGYPPQQPGYPAAQPQYPPQPGYGAPAPQPGYPAQPGYGQPPPQPGYPQQQQPGYPQAAYGAQQARTTTTTTTTYRQTGGRQTGGAVGAGAMMGGLLGGLIGGIAAAASGGNHHHRLLQHGQKVHFDNVHTGRNLRIKPNGQIDAQGGNGRPATWTVHAHGSHFKFKNGVGHFLAIKGDSVCGGQGGRFCELVVQPHNGHFVIRSPDGRSGVAFPDGGNYPKAASHVGRGRPAQFQIRRA